MHQTSRFIVVENPILGPVLPTETIIEEPISPRCPVPLKKQEPPTTPSQESRTDLGVFTPAYTSRNSSIRGNRSLTKTQIEHLFPLRISSNDSPPAVEPKNTWLGENSGRNSQTKLFQGKRDFLKERVTKKSLKSFFNDNTRKVLGIGNKTSYKM